MTGPASAPDRSRRLILLAVGGLGVSAVMTQLVLMRELLAAFSGNELVFGISLGSWLLLTGAGAWLGRWISCRGAAGCAPDADHAPRAQPAAPLQRMPGAATPTSPIRDDGVAVPIGFLIAGLIAVAAIPLAQVVAVRVLRDVVFIRGAAVGVGGTVLGCLALLLPFCLVSGALLTLACALLARREGAPGIGRVYVADSVGSIGGGILFSFVLVPWFDHFALLCFPAFLSLLLAAGLAGHFHKRLLLASTLIVAAGLALHTMLIDADDVTTAVQHWGRPTVFRGNSPYGRLVITDDSGQLTFFENGVPVITTHNLDRIEETVHYAMSQRPDARRVLLISGGVAGTAREILRYGVGEVTYVEIDPLIIAAGRRFLPEYLADPRIKTVATDGRRFVQQTAGRFDVVIVDVADPSTAQLNRFYTAGFFAEVRRILNPGGVFAFGLGHYENYVSPELARLLSSARRTLQPSFARVRMIPGGRVFFLASDGPLSLDIAARLEQRRLATKLVRRPYLEAMLAPDRLADLDRAVAQPADPNTDLNPALYYYQLRHWLSQFTVRAGLPVGALLVLLGIYLLRQRALPRVIFASGFAASALEVVLLLGFQALYGSLYRQVGLVVTVFMAGLAAGAWMAGRRLDGWNALAATHAGSAAPPPLAGRMPPSVAADVRRLARAATAGLAEGRRPILSLVTSAATRLFGFRVALLHRGDGAQAGPRRDAASGRRHPAMPPYTIVLLLSLALAGLAVLLPCLLPALGRLDAIAGQGVVLLLTFLLAALVGGQFPLAAAAEPGEAAVTASRLYTADFLGAALGALLVSTLLVPLLGVAAVCLCTAALNLAAAAIAWRPATPS
ncbi:MAG: fused MFS/spermidine synthase [Opitutaceae bacterium]|nr:fused MFS/spermidine synthase [Opitutaceae bacterium]